MSDFSNLFIYTIFIIFSILLHVYLICCLFCSVLHCLALLNTIVIAFSFCFALEKLYTVLRPLSVSSLYAKGGRLSLTATMEEQLCTQSLIWGSCVVDTPIDYAGKVCMSAYYMFVDILYSIFDLLHCY